MPPSSLNLLLESLPPKDLAHLLASSEAIALPLRTILYSAGTRPRYAYFLTDGIASVVFNSNAGQIAEVGITGREGLVGAMHLLGRLPFPAESFMQIAGSGHRILLSELEKRFRDSIPFRDKILEFSQFTYLTASILAACNALHSIEARLSRWLLVIRDRLQAESYALTHEFLAEMLVVQRPTLSIVAAALQREGVIHYRHGQLEILDRERLEKTACECYSISRNLLRLLYSQVDVDNEDIESTSHPTVS